MQQSDKHIAENNELNKFISLIKEELELKNTKVSELEAQVFSTKNIVDDHEQLKKTHKDIIKENYKLKGEYISTSTSNLNENAKN